MPEIALGRAQSAKRRGQVRAVVNIRTDTYGSGPVAPGGKSDADWRKQRIKDLGSEIAALEKQLSGFDAKDAAEKVRKALDLELRTKRLDLEQAKLRLEG